MAASTATCSSPLGAAIARFRITELLQQRASPGVPDIPSQFSPPRSFDGSGDATRTALVSNSNQLCRLAGFAVAAATAWAGFSMCPPMEALAMVYETADHQNAVELTMNKFAGSELVDNASIPNLVMPEMETLTVGNVPSIKPPNEGLNSPWIPKINGLKKNKIEDIKRRMGSCPQWTMRELEMVLPDLQGKPKPFPHTQSQVYPFWPAAIVDRAEEGQDDNSSEKELNELALAQATSFKWIDGVNDTHDDRETNLSDPALPPPPQQDQVPIKKARSCFTM